MEESVEDRVEVLLSEVDNSVGASIKSISGLGLSGSSVQGVDHRDDSLAGVVHVKDGREGIQTASMELVAISHGEFSELLKVAGLDGGLHVLHTLRDNNIGTVLHERRGLNGSLHTGGGGDTLLTGVHDEDENTHILPILLRGDLDSVTVRSVVLLAHLPLDKSAVQGSRSRAGTLASNGTELPIECFLHTVNSSKTLGETSISRSRRSESSSGREVVVRHNTELVLAPVLLLDEHLTVRISVISSALADLSENGRDTLGKLLFPVIPGIAGRVW